MHVKHNDFKQKAQAGQVLLSSDDEKRTWLSDLDTSQQHPYENEILNFKIPENQLSFKEPIPFKPLSETPLIIVDTESELKKLVEKLNGATEIGVDVEHHSHRSFLGLTCLIQISTHDEDYIIDPFPIWGSMWRLNEPFTNPKILKVFHGADSDVLWLQRDFGIYVINMLDTYVLMQFLDQPKRSLKALVSSVCNINLDKSHQREDWRIR